MAAAGAAFSSIAVLDQANNHNKEAGSSTTRLTDSPNDSTTPLPEKKRRRRNHGAEEGKRYACDYQGCTKCKSRCIRTRDDRGRVSGLSLSNCAYTQPSLLLLAKQHSADQIT